MVSMTITRLIGLGKKMIEIGLLVISWYVIGILSMLMIQCWVDKHAIEERKTWPGHKVGHEVGRQEVFVLGVCGPLVLAVILYFAVTIWLITRDDNT